MIQSNLYKPESRHSTNRGEASAPASFYPLRVSAVSAFKSVKRTTTEDSIDPKRVASAAASAFEEFSEGTLSATSLFSPRNLDYILDTAPHPNSDMLPKETTLTYTYDDFFQKLDHLNNIPFGTPRLEALLSQLALIKDYSADSKSEQIQAECWITKDKSYLHFVVSGGPYYSTYLPKETDKAKNWIYFNLAEWRNIGGGRREYAAVQIRLDLDAGTGEWMWIRKNPSFTGTQAMQWAKQFSHLFLRQAEMIDLAKLKLGNVTTQISFWNTLAIETPQSIYSKYGFDIPDLINVKIEETTISQNKALYISAVHYLRNKSIEEVSSLLKHNISKKAILTGQRLTEMAKKYKCEQGTLTTLFQKFHNEQRNSEKKLPTLKMHLYSLASGTAKFKPEGQWVAMAAKINASILILRASAPYAPLTYSTEDNGRLFESSIQEYQTAGGNMSEKDDFIKWFSRKTG